MAIDTAQKKFALIAFGRTTEPMNLPVAGGEIEQDDQQQFLWSYPGVLFVVREALTYVHDLNTRLYVYLLDFYSISSGDLTTMVMSYLANEKTGTWDERWRQMERDALDSML